MNRLSKGCVVYTLGLIAAGITGCPNSNGTTELTEEQKQAVTAVAERVVSSTQSLAAGLPAVQQVEDETETTEICPEISLEAIEGVIRLDLDYGAGCIPPAQGNTVVSGLLSITGSTVTRTLSVMYDDLSIEGRTVDGEVELMFTPAIGTTTIEVGYDLNASDHGMISGNASVIVDFQTGTLTTTEAMWTFVDLDQETYRATADGLFYDPRQYRNLIPAAGTVTFEIPNEATRAEDDMLTLVVTFDENSPVTRTVHVTVGPLSAGSVTLPTPEAP